MISTTIMNRMEYMDKDIKAIKLWIYK